VENKFYLKDRDSNVGRIFFKNTNVKIYYNQFYWVSKSEIFRCDGEYFELWNLATWVARFNHTSNENFRMCYKSNVDMNEALTEELVEMFKRDDFTNGKKNFLS
jgi:hypothetical protein